MLEEILPDLHNAKIFSKLDLREGYHQILLDEESQLATHDSVYQHKQLIHGINSAFVSFRKETELVITEINNAKNINIIIWGTSQEQHNKTLEKVFSWIIAYSLKNNKEKCIFSLDLITFSGHTLTSDGITTDQKNIKAINNTQTPTNTSQIYKIIFGYNKLLSSIYCQLLNHNRTFETTQKSKRLAKKNQKFMKLFID